MEIEKLIGRLELAYGCLIGSHTSGITPRQQFESIINDLKLVKNIGVIPCCETVKENYTHTFEVDLNNEQVQKQRCEYIEQIHALPTRLFMYNPKTDEYIELKP